MGEVLGGGYEIVAAGRDPSPATAGPSSCLDCCLPLAAASSLHEQQPPLRMVVPSGQGPLASSLRCGEPTAPACTERRREVRASRRGAGASYFLSRSYVVALLAGALVVLCPASLSSAFGEISAAAFPAAATSGTGCCVTFLILTKAVRGEGSNRPALCTAEFVVFAQPTTDE